VILQEFGEGREVIEDEIQDDGTDDEVSVANYGDVADFFDQMRAEEMQAEALEAFLSVGARPVEVGLKDDRDGRKGRMVRTVAFETADRFAGALPALLAESDAHAWSLIVRLRGEGIVQVDDCGARAVELLSPLSFLVAETSPGNYQAWLAVAEPEIDEIRRRIFAGLASQGLNGNGGAYGAMRWPGSRNHKPERGGGNGAPLVRVVSSSPGRKVTVGELGQANLLPELPEVLPSAERPAVTFSGPQRWPDYDLCLSSKPSRSEADASFVTLSFRRGFTASEIAVKLAEVSERARGNRRYVERTVRRVEMWLRKAWSK
jgi:hypothetical protein